MVIWFLFFIPWTWDIALVDFRWLCSSDKTLLVVHVPFYASPDLSRWYFVCSWGMLVCGIRVKRLLPWRGRSPSWPWDWYYFLLKCNSLGNQYAFFFFKTDSGDLAEGLTSQTLPRGLLSGSCRANLLREPSMLTSLTTYSRSGRHLTPLKT